MWFERPGLALVMHGGYDHARDKGWSDVEWFFREGRLWAAPPRAHRTSGLDRSRNAADPARGRLRPDPRVGRDPVLPGRSGDPSGVPDLIWREKPRAASSMVCTLRRVMCCNRVQFVKSTLQIRDYLRLKLPDLHRLFNSGVENARLDGRTLPVPPKLSSSVMLLRIFRASPKKERATALPQGLSLEMCTNESDFALTLIKIGPVSVREQ
jgi:hypothetical protein